MIIFPPKDLGTAPTRENTEPLLPTTVRPEAEASSSSARASAHVPEPDPCPIVHNFSFSHRKGCRRLSKRTRRRFCFSFLSFVVIYGLLRYLCPILQNERLRYQDSRHISFPSELSLGRCARNITDRHSNSPGVFSVDMDAAYLLARGSLSSGEVVVIQTESSSGPSSLKSKLAKVTVSATTEDASFTEYFSVCEIKERGGKLRSGVGIFSVPYRPRVTGRITVTVELPAGPTRPLHARDVKLDMPEFSLTFGKLDNVKFDHLDIRSSGKPIVANWVSMQRGHIETSNAPIKGTVFTTSEISVRTSNAPIDLDLQMHDPYPGAPGYSQVAADAPPIEASLKTTNGFIQAYTNLTACEGKNSSFVIDASTSRGTIVLDFVKAPEHSRQIISASTSFDTIDVTTHKNFEGSYRLQTLPPFRDVVAQPATQIDSVTGAPVSGRVLWHDYESLFMEEGAITWGVAAVSSMIIDAPKVPLPNDPTPSDAPPSYDTLLPLAPGPANVTPGDTKLPHLYPPTSPAPYSTTLSPRSPRSIGSGQPPLPPECCDVLGKSKGKLALSWFNFAASRTDKDVRNTVLGLIRDLVREHHSDSAAPAGILASCAAACEGRSLSLSTILQEKSIESHTPLYWAIVKRRPDEDVEDGAQIPDLLIALLSHSTPLSRETIMDIRHACLITSDQRLFQRLRMSPEFATVSGKDQMLLGVTLPHDEVEVEELAGEEGEFAVNFVIPHFQKRMMVTQDITLEFIARSRMWKLSFAIAQSNQAYSGIKAGSWTITLGLQDNSPPTWIDSRLVVTEPPPPDLSAPDAPPSSPTPPSSNMSNFFGLSSPKPPKGRPPIFIRLPCRERLQIPVGFSKGYQIVVALEDSPSAATLQYAGNPYIAADEKLRVRLEARLRMPEQECIIC